MQMNHLQELLIEDLKDLYNAEQQLLKALPKMAKKASSPDLKQAFVMHTRETEGQVKRLEQVFQALGSKAKGKTCHAMKGLIEEGNELMGEDIEPDVLDAGLIGAAQKVEHYEMAGYGTARTYARLLGNEQAARLLQQTLDEEGQTDKKLTALAESHINVEAADMDDSDVAMQQSSSRSSRSRGPSKSGGRSRR
jgi:ferritin-like metal-binding protein YciE